MMTSKFTSIPLMGVSVKVGEVQAIACWLETMEGKVDLEQSVEVLV